MICDVTAAVASKGVPCRLLWPVLLSICNEIYSTTQSNQGGPGRHSSVPCRLSGKVATSTYDPKNIIRMHHAVIGMTYGVEGKEPSGD